MTRCGCASQNCSCQINGSDSILVTGDGSRTNPYVITSLVAPNIAVADSGSVDLTLTGSGTIDDPLVLSAVATLTIPSVSVSTYTASATWTRPTGKSIARVTIIGAGGGGGSGRRGAANTLRAGGGGGCGGACSRADFYVTDLPSSVAVTIGAPGTGGAAVTVDNTNGNNGTNGGDTLFGTLLRAGGGTGGFGGTTFATGDYSGPPSYGMFPGTSGGGDISQPGGQSGVGFSVTAGHDQAVGSAGFGATGGGSGGYLSTTNVLQGAGTGGPNYPFQVAGGTLGTAGAAGGNGNLPATGPLGIPVPGTGGGGGGSSVTAAAGGGGNGVRGGGGGGGGASQNTFSSGAGGTGGGGYCAVAVW